MIITKINKFLLSLIIFISFSVNANFHIWDISEVYSNEDGSVQFIELFCPQNGQEFLNAHQIAATSDGNTVTFTFPGNSGSPTLNKSLLIATSNFAALPGAVTPDFILPDNFINPNASAIVLNFGLGQDIMNFTGTQLPSDGVNSIDRNLVQATNSPTNFAGEAGSINAIVDLVFRNGFD
jgi:hypothetical protein